VGYTWGRGTLHYRGRDYPFSVNGLTLINVGAEKVEATAEVYNLTKWKTSWVATAEWPPAPRWSMAPRPE
jgi:hypothetical protein